KVRRMGHESCAGDVVVEAAADRGGGVPGAGTSQYSEAWNTTSIPLASMLFELKAGTWQSEANAPGAVIFDNFNAGQTGSSGVANYTYDAAGNVTSDGVHTYQYDAENRIVSVDNGSTAAYAYDFKKRRFSKTVANTTTHYIWEGGRVLAEHNGSNGAVLVEYIGGVAKIVGGSTSYFLSDRLSLRLTLDGAGNVLGRQAHLPFGEDFAETGQQDKHHFISYEADPETGQNYAVNRFCTASVGRFMSSDPYRQSGYGADPQSWNRYAYTRDDPINKVDELGLDDGPKGPNEYMDVWGYLAVWGLLGGGGFGGNGPRQPTLFDNGHYDRPEPQRRLPARPMDHQQLRTNFKKFLNTMSDSCKKALSQYTKRLSNLVDTIRFYNVDDISQVDAAKWFRNLPGTKGLTVGQWFDNLGNAAETTRGT